MPRCPVCDSEIGVVVEVGAHNQVIGVRLICTSCGWSRHTWKYMVQKLYGVLSW